MKFIKNKTEWRIYENISQARKILSDNKQTENNDKYSYIKKGLGNNTGYLGWFTKMIFNSPELTKGDFDYIINFIKNDKYIIESLPKDLIKYESWESLIDDILNIQSNRNIKKIYNELPNSIKELLNYKELSKREKGSFLSLFNNENRRIFLSKVSRYRTESSFFDALELFLSNTSSSYNSILSDIDRVGANIIHSSEDNDIIICEVNYKQIRVLGSDTSWCIVPSEGTFNNYVRDNNRQFIIYLTDLTDNYSKIGATIGFSFNTAHKKNDRYISEYDLIQLLNARKFDIRNLFQNKDEFLKKNDINRISVNTLLKDVGVSKEFIIKNKKSFTNSDIQNFNQMEIHVYKLNKKIEIKNFNSLKEEAGDTNITNYIIDNLDRIIFKLDMNNILEIQPSPNSLELLYPITYDTTKKEIDSILKYKYNGENLVSKDMSNFTTYKLITTNWEDKESESRKYDIDYLIYTLKICNIYPQNVNKYSIKLPHLKYYDSIKLLKHFIINGYKFTSTEIFNYFSDLISGSYIRTKESDWLSVLESFPEIKDKLRDIIESSIEKVQYYDLELELIDKYYPDIYESAKEHSSIIKQFAEFKRITPYKNYQDADKFFKNIDYKVWIENLYSKYINTKNGGLLKKARLESREQIGLIIIILIKLDKFDEFNEFTNIKWHTWGKSILSYMVRMGLNRVNPTSAPELQLTKSECEKLLNELPKIDIGNILSKHFSLSLVYYIKGWGFNNYLKFIRSVEIKDSESRMYYMKYVLSYLISEDRYSDAKEVVDIVMSWEMSDKEKSKSIEDINSSYFIEIDNNSKSEKIDKWRNYIKKYYK